jgi:hypothetical protein
MGVFLLGASTLPAQCPTSNTQFGSGNLAGCPSAPVTFTTCAFAGEYSLANGIVAGNVYTFTGTGGSGNYLTIIDNATLTPVGFGFSPVTVTATATTSYRVQVNTSAPPACGTESACHALAGSCAAPAAPAITVTKTVGTTAGVCAATSEITVDAGTTVYYCYAVTNTGDVTLDLHTLVDDQLGTIFSGLNYALTPGSSVNTVAAGVSAPAVMTVTTTNVATWTASTAAGLSAEGTATATVTVLAPSVLEIPTLSPMGLAGLVALLALAAFWLLRARRRVA